MAVATQEVFYHTDAKVQVWDMGAAAPARTLIVKNSVPGVSLTNTASITDDDTITIGPYSIERNKVGGVGNDKATAVDATDATAVAIDGTWEFESVLATNATDPAPTSTAQGAIVYVTSGGVVSLSSSGNTRIGIVNYPAIYTKVAGTLPVAIGL